jgi:hypothetical protein
MHLQEADARAEAINFSAVRNCKSARRQIPKPNNAYNHSLEKFNLILNDNSIIICLSY